MSEIRPTRKYARLRVSWKAVCSPVDGSIGITMTGVGEGAEGTGVWVGVALGTLGGVLVGV